MDKDEKFEIGFLTEDEGKEKRVVGYSMKNLEE
jgi:hypothetical protein